MGEFVERLEERFGKERIQQVPESIALDHPLLLLNLEKEANVTLLLTNGLSDYEMPLPEKAPQQPFNELYFCLPSYWDWNDFENPNFNWVFDWLQRLAVHVKEKQTWFGNGHTLQCGKEMTSLSTTMLQNHFFLSDPILLENEMRELPLKEKTVHFLSVIPIFPDEMDYKQGKGTLKLKEKLIGHGISEKLDDYRGTVLRSKWRLRR